MFKVAVLSMYIKHNVHQPKLACLSIGSGGLPVEKYCIHKAGQQHITILWTLCTRIGFKFGSMCTSSEDNTCKTDIFTQCDDQCDISVIIQI